MAFANAGQFAISGDNLNLVVNPNLITQPAAGLTDTYIVTMNNSSGGGTTLATVIASHGSVKIDSIRMSSGALVINTAAISGVTAPATGATPVTSVTGPGYTGTVAWNGSPTTFAAATTYTATITLTAVTGYTLTGVGANFFTVAGTSPAASNALNSGVITAAFPSTVLPAGYLISGGLTWAPINSSSNLSTAQSTCATSTALGYAAGAWRQPSKDELVALYSLYPNNSATLSALGWTLFFTWSSTDYGGGNHYQIYLAGGNEFPDNDANLYYVSCVH